MPKRLEMFSIIRRSASVTVSMFVTSLRSRGLSPALSRTKVAALVSPSMASLIWDRAMASYRVMLSPFSAASFCAVSVM